jgi:hypothetical protein
VGSGRVPTAARNLRNWRGGVQLPDTESSDMTLKRPLLIFPAVLLLLLGGGAVSYAAHTRAWCKHYEMPSEGKCWLKNGLW